MRITIKQSEKWKNFFKHITKGLSYNSVSEDGWIHQFPDGEITEMYDFKNCFEFYEIQEMNYDLKKFFENLENVSEEELGKLTYIKRLY